MGGLGIGGGVYLDKILIIKYDIFLLTYIASLRVMNLGVLFHLEDSPMLKIAVASGSGF